MKHIKLKFVIKLLFSIVFKVSEAAFITYSMGKMPKFIFKHGDNYRLIKIDFII